MSHTAAAIILAIVTALAVVIAAPFMYLARRRRKRVTGTFQQAGGQVPMKALPGLAAYVAVLFFGFAYAYTEPETWFGQQMKTGVGRLSFFLVPLLIAIVFGYVQATRKRVDAGQTDAQGSK